MSNYWDMCLRPLFGDSLPDDYLTFDLETTGWHTNFDLPIDFGYTIVRDRKPVQSGGMMLDWTRYPDWVELAWLDDRLRKIDAEFRQTQGRPFGYSVARLQKHGRDPVKVLEFILKLFTINRQAGASFAGHNLTRYDAPMLMMVLNEYLGVPWEFDEDEYIDTGAIEKSIQCFLLQQDKQLLPKPHEFRTQFYRRVVAVPRKDIHWRLSTCVERYNLAERYNLDVAQLHGAKMDSYVCHLLLEEHRREAGVA